MGIRRQINRITQNIENTYAVLETLGADMPDEQNSDNLAETASSITATALPELTNEGAAADLMEGKQLISGAGEVVSGSFTLRGEMTEQSALLARIKSALAGKAAGGGGEAMPTQRKTVDITKNGTTEIAPDDGFVLSGVTARVNVPIPDGYIVPSGTKEIFANGTYDVTDKKSVVVSVPEREIVLQNKEITENGTYTADAGYDGLGQVTINVPSGGVVEPDYKDLYQRVEYITSAVEETYPYIITDFYADNTCGVEVIASFPKMQDRIPMGSRENSDATRFYCVYPLSTSSIYYGFNTGNTISCALKVDTIYRLQTNFLNSRLVNVYDKDGNRKGGGAISSTLTTQTAPVSIFGYHSASSGTVSSKREFKLYGARCSKGHEVVREYIPCYRKSDGVVGVFEKITGQFLTSETDAAFTKGADIEW